MAYKPVSQIVSDNKDAEIPSSDAINDRIVAEITAVIPEQEGNDNKFLQTDGSNTSWATVPESANLTLSNLTAPTAVNQNLNMGTNQLRFNTLNSASSISISAPADVATGVFYVPYENPNWHPTMNPIDRTLINTDSSITNILQIGDVIYLNGLTQRGVVLAKNSDTQVKVSRAMGDGSSREIYIEPSYTSFVSNTTSILNISKSGSITLPAGSLNNQPLQFTNDPAVGIYSSGMNQISFSGRNPDNNFQSEQVGYERVRFNMSATSGEFRLLGINKIVITGTDSFNLQHGWGVFNPVSFLSADRENMYFHRATGMAQVDTAQNISLDTAFCLGIPTSNGLASVSARRFFGGAFRQKLQVGNFSNPGYFVDGGVLSVHGLDQDIGNSSFIKTNGTNVISHISGYAGSTRVATMVRAVGMGIGDTIQITKANQPTIWRKIIREGNTIPDDTNTYGSGLQYVLDDVVSADYDGGNIAVLPALVRVATQNDAEVIEVDYAGNSKFKPVQAVELSSGNLSIASLGRSLQMATGSNAAAGLATIANGDPDVTVSTMACGPNSIILVTNNTSDAHVSVSSKALGSFKIDHGANVTGDQSCAWFIINPEDVDFVSFITTASISDSTQQSAIATLISSLKSQGLWDAMTAIYPFVGGTDTAHSYNLKNPAEYQITWSGTVTHDANGITGNGTDGYGDTNIAGSILFQNNQHLSVYSRTNSVITATDIGAAIAADATKGSHFAIRTAVASNPTRWANSAAQSSVNSIVTNTQGLFVATRQVSNAQVFYRNTGILANSATVNSEALAFPETITIGARKSGASVVDYSTRNYAFASLGRGLTTPQVVRLYAIVQAFQTTLGRNV